MELRILKAILSLSDNPRYTGAVHFINDSMVNGMNADEQERFTKLFFDYPEFKDRYEEARTPQSEFEHERFSEFPPNTLGYHYAKFMNHHKFSVYWYPVMKEISPVHFARNHQYLTHDVLHTITGFDGNSMGEIGLQGFYTGQQAPNPTAMTVFTAASLHNLKASDPKENTKLLDYITEGYVMGKSAQRVIFRRWEDDWNTDISELREQLGIRPHVQNAY